MKNLFTCHALMGFVLLFLPFILKAQTDTPPHHGIEIDLPVKALADETFSVFELPQPTPVLGRIVGGQNADIKDFPWQVSVANFSFQQFCGGSVIDKYWILTASHCLEDFTHPSQLRIRAGVTNRTATTGQDRRVAAFYLHPSYGTNGYYNDIALIKLASPLDLSSENVSVIPLVTPIWAIQGLQNPGVMAAITGWGSTSSGGPSPNILQSAFVPIVSNGVVNRPGSYGGQITDDMIAAGFIETGGVDACQGDSGGPLAVPDGASPVGYRLAGVTSFGNGCGLPGFPGIYSRVSYNIDWIEEVTGLEFGHGPAPQAFQATVSEDEPSQVDFMWEPPQISIDNWYTYNQNFTHLTALNLQRATKFSLNHFHLQGAVNLTKVSHTFFQPPSAPWTSNEFRYNIYDADGQTLLYQSPILNASNLVEAIHELTEPVSVEGSFYVAVQAIASNGHPHSLMQLVSGGTNSYAGSAGSWQLYQSGANFFEFSMAAFIEAQDPVPGDPVQFLQGYKLLRNGVPVYTTDDQFEMTYSDAGLIDGNYRYELVAVLGGKPSDYSPAKNISIETGECLPVSNFPYSEIFEGDFPAPCWTLNSTADNTWDLSQGYVVGAGQTAQHIFSVEGSNFAYVQWTNQELQDEWLISPAMDFSELDWPRLEFSFNGSFYHSVTLNRIDLDVYVSDDGENWEHIWNETDMEGFTSNDANYQWFRPSIPLRNYENLPTVWVAFNYSGTNGANFAIDKVTVFEGDPIIEYAVTIATEGQGSTVPEPGEYIIEENDTFTVEAFPADGHRFLYWQSGSQQLTQNPLTITVTQDTLLTAHFEAIPEFTLTVLMTGEGSINLAPGDYTYEEGTIVNLVASNQGMWIFQKWTVGDQEFETPAINVNMNADKTAHAFFQDVTSVSDPEAFSGLVVFPNPASGKFYVKMQEGIAFGALRVIDALGNIVFAKNLEATTPSQTIEIDGSAWIRGIYFVSLSSENGVKTKTIVISN